MSALRELSERMLAGHDLPPGLPVAPGPGERLPGDVLLAPSFANVGAVPTDEGLVLIDAGGMLLAPRAHEDLRRLSEDPVHTVVYTHGHVDHVMGAELLGDDVRVVAHERVRARFERYRRTRGWNAAINKRQFGLEELEWPADFRDPDVVFHDALDLEVGGVRFALRHARGETDDHLYAWVPDRGVLFCADYFTWSLPNAGNPQKAQRYPVEWAAALRAMAALGAELAVPGHGPPLFGADVVRRVLDETAAALESLIEQVLARMNAGAGLDEVLHAVRLPDALRERPYLRSAYDDEEFVVRAIWRTFGGWWDGDPASLKPAPDAALAAELAALAGGVPRLAERAHELAQAGDRRLATHLARLAELAGATDVADVYERRAEAEPSLMARGIFAAAARRMYERT
jgi:alkyl sulfatase BDS1-like metallo-beta-lactamase superfamily hydrolase